MLISLLVACAAETAPEAFREAPSPAEDSVSRRRCTEAQPCPLEARLTADVVAGSYPLEVVFDAGSSLRGAGSLSFDWDFGDGVASGARRSATHTYVGEGTFVAQLTLVDGASAVSVAEVEVVVSAPSCPTADAAVAVGTVGDPALDELSGIVASPTDPEAFWVHEDSGNAAVLIAIDEAGATLGRHDLTGAFTDLEDLAAAVDPETGAPLLFVGDIGDNGYSRGEIAVWVLEEPDPRASGPVAPFRMGLDYPDGPKNAETLLVDPLTLDLYIVTKESSSAPSVYRKPAPHVAGGPFTLEALGVGATLPWSATGGDVSADGAWIAVRDYGDTAQLYRRDGYLPFEAAFDGVPCPVTIHSEQQGEAIAFTSDGSALVTVSEGVLQPVYQIAL